MDEGSGRGIVRLDPLGHPHVRNEMGALWEELLELATVEKRLLRLWSVERVQLWSHSQI